MKISSYLTLGDWVVLMGFTFLAGALFFVVPQAVLSSSGDVDVYVQDKPYGRYSLNENKTLDIQGKLGVTTVRIQNGFAEVVSSACPNKSCIHMGGFGAGGGFIVCIPNEVVIKSGKGEGTDFDAVNH
jgi:hypothetical protein